MNGIELCMKETESKRGLGTKCILPLSRHGSCQAKSKALQPHTDCSYTYAISMMLLLVPALAGLFSSR